MRVLLLGDYSSFFFNLKAGLIELGHECEIATSGDGFKKTGKSDLHMPNTNKDICSVLEKINFGLKGIKDYYDFDVVFLINHVVFPPIRFNYNYYLLKKIKKHSKKMFLSSCGTDYFVYKSKDKHRYNPIDAGIQLDSSGKNVYVSNRYIKNNVDIVNLVDGVIPTMYTYADAYRDNDKLIKTIQFPMDASKIKFIPQTFQNKKVKIFHGINREGFKGTKFIREAMIKLKENYPNDVEIIIDGRMPLNQYLKILEETNIVVDQALSYEYGMNAVYSMAMGKVVLSGNEPESQLEFGRDDIPIVNIKPSAEYIYQVLENLVLDKEKIIEIGSKSRKFVEDFHDHIKVAQQYIDVWNCAQNE